MHDFLVHRPAVEEYDSFYSTYVDAVPAGDVLTQLREQKAAVESRFERLSEVEADHRYEDDKWSVKEVLGHMADTERVFAYRALCFSRGDNTALPGMDQDVFMSGSRFSHRTLSAIVDEFLSVRAATLTLLESFDPVALGRSGEASGCPVTVRALVFIIAGHAGHHLRVLEERYGV